MCDGGLRASDDIMRPTLYRAAGISGWQARRSWFCSSCHVCARSRQPAQETQKGRDPSQLRRVQAVRPSPYFSGHYLTFFAIISPVPASNSAATAQSHAAPASSAAAAPSAQMLRSCFSPFPWLTHFTGLPHHRPGQPVRFLRPPGPL